MVLKTGNVLLKQGHDALPYFFYCPHLLQWRLYQRTLLPPHPGVSQPVVAGPALTGSQPSYISKILAWGPQQTSHLTSWSLSFSTYK